MRPACEAAENGNLNDDIESRPRLSRHGEIGRAGGRAGRGTRAAHVTASPVSRVPPCGLRARFHPLRDGDSDDIAGSFRDPPRQSVGMFFSSHEDVSWWKKTTGKDLKGLRLTRGCTRHTLVMKCPSRELRCSVRGSGVCSALRKHGTAAQSPFWGPPGRLPDETMAEPRLDSRSARSRSAGRAFLQPRSQRWGGPSLHGLALPAEVVTREGAGRLPRAEARTRGALFQTP